VTESLYSQIAAAEETLRASESQLGRLRQLHAALAGLVGRAEAADGRVVVECTSGEGITKLELDPYAMRMQSGELAQAIKTAIAEANDHLRAQIQQAVAEAGSAGAVPAPEELRGRLAAAREQFIGAARTAAGGLADANRLLNQRTTR